MKKIRFLYASWLAPKVNAYVELLSSVQFLICLGNLDIFTWFNGLFVTPWPRPGILLQDGKLVFIVVQLNCQHAIAAADTFWQTFYLSFFFNIDTCNNIFDFYWDQSLFLQNLYFHLWNNYLYIDSSTKVIMVS